MTITPAFVLILMAGCLLNQEVDAANFSEPLLPASYRNKLDLGFSTNWFKSSPPLSKYNVQNIKDVRLAGFKHLRLRCRADLYTYPYNDTEFDSFLDDLETVVDDCINENVFPVISWIHHEAEAYGTDEDFDNYLRWWRKVARKLKDKDFRLSFNLFTELGIDECQHTGNCDGSLKEDTAKYNKWTSRVVKAIRGTGGNNDKRILILTSPKKTAKGLKDIDHTIYQNDNYMMAEFHIYASGPNKKEGSPKYWVGNGTTEQRQTLLDEIAMAENDIPLKLYFGAWMAHDNNFGGLNQSEVENFARYFVSVMKTKKIPSSLNVLDNYYDTKDSVWITGIANISGQPLDMAAVLGIIKQNM